MTAAPHPHFDNDQWTETCHLVKCFEWIALASESLSLLLVGKENIYLAISEFAQKVEILFHDVETGQIKGYIHAMRFGCARCIANKCVVLYQITFDVEIIISGKQSFIQM